MENSIQRFPSKCSWCRWGNTLPQDTWCSNDGFKLRTGENNWPDIANCPIQEFEFDKNVTLVDVLWWPIAWAAAEVDRLEIKNTLN